MQRKTKNSRRAARGNNRPMQYKAEYENRVLPHTGGRGKGGQKTVACGGVLAGPLCTISN